MMETLKDLQLEHLMVPMVRAVLDLVVLIMVAKTFDVPVALGAPALTALVLATTVAVPAPAARRLWRSTVESDWNNTWSSGQTLT